MGAFDLGEACAVLERTPATLRAWLLDLPEPWVRANEGPDTWSPYDVVGHLVDGELTDWMPRLRRILEQGTTVPFDKFDRTLHFERPQETMADRLDRFATVRAVNLEALRALGLGPTELAKHGMHPALGEVTAEMLLATWVAHDLDHMTQIARVMAKRYEQAVGPWTQYLRVISGKPG